MDMIEPEKTAVIDVGSNSVRLVVYHGTKRAPLQFFNEKVACGLGRGLANSGVLHPAGRKRALAAIQRFVGIAERLGVQKLHTVATSAVRNATDGPDFCDDVLLATNVSLNVVTGAEEGRLSAQGVFFCRPDAQGLVCDVGGSSVELAKIGGGIVEHAQTSELGPLPLQRFDGDMAALEAEIEDQLNALTKSFEPQETLYMIGGTIRSMASLDIQRKDYPLSVVNEYTLTGDEFRDLLDWIINAETDEIETYGTVSSDRLIYFPAVARVMLGLLARIQPKQIVFSSFGIREGLLYENMPARIQKRDPLIEACQFFEKSDARFAEFGTTLYAWVLPLFGPIDDARKRLIWAACLLHDVTWKAHPDYRAEVSFGYPTRANLVGLDHQERIFLAVALIHRYRNKPKVDKLEELNGLLSVADQAQAEVLGRAMRLGAMLGGPDVAHMGQLKVAGDKVELVIDSQSAGLIGEVVEHRLNSLAKAMGKQAKLRVE